MDRRKVLILDDEKDVAEVVRSACEFFGWEAHATSSPDEFRGIIHSAPPDVIIMDLIMPGTDGVQILRFLAETKVIASIILMSGSDRRVIQSAGQVAQAHGLSVLGILPKPIQLSELREALGKVGLSQENSAPQKKQAASVPVTPDQIQESLRDEHFVVFFQPQVELENGKTVGCEALVRLAHPVRGMIFPDQFIPVAEDSGLISELTDMVWRKAVRFCRELKQAGYDIRVAVNISALLLSDVTLPDRLFTIVQEEGVSPYRMIAEVTESRLFEDAVRALDVLTRIRMKGMELSIDDFGMGYSTLQQLQQVPSTELKIDLSFVRACETSDEAKVIVQTSINLARRLGLRAIAEGIETKEIANTLLGWGCLEGQGYYYSRPQSSEAFLLRLQTGSV